MDIKYEQHLQFVKEYMIQHGGYDHPNPLFNFRSKYEHTRRVLRWCEVILEDFPSVHKEALYTAAIFHDIGYAGNKDEHAERSAKIFEEYARKNCMDSALAEQVIYLIRMHSDKELLKNPKTVPELILLMEADLLDEEGALRVIWYCATKAIQGADRYSDFDDFIRMGSEKRLENPMVTPIAWNIWERKIRLVNEFSEELSNDINVRMEE